MGVVQPKHGRSYQCRIPYQTTKHKVATFENERTGTNEKRLLQHIDGPVHFTETGKSKRTDEIHQIANRIGDHGNPLQQIGKTDRKQGVARESKQHLNNTPDNMFFPRSTGFPFARRFVSPPKHVGQPLIRRAHARPPNDGSFFDLGVGFLVGFAFAKLSSRHR